MIRRPATNMSLISCPNDELALETRELRKEQEGVTILDII
jgi:hypothetical protein